MVWHDIVQFHGNETALDECWSRGIRPEAELCDQSQDASAARVWKVNHEGEWRALFDSLKVTCIVLRKYGGPRDHAYRTPPSYPGSDTLVQRQFWVQQ
ncbi:hypothetical protein DPMN_046973 [Dreissena polymorpha]|uniref:Uncharacterized protein n=1 Tax=Dreissena polymorpha TaxID=45954 RepID=A0A9D4D9J3_DREPO|nr:hypothetical protein DPMN_046973 [Dreissena polymorpha]